MIPVQLETRWERLISFEGRAWMGEEEGKIWWRSCWDVRGERTSESERGGVRRGVVVLRKGNEEESESGREEGGEGG
jgi:hypothetical protein